MKAILDFLDTIFSSLLRFGGCSFLENTTECMRDTVEFIVGKADDRMKGGTKDCWEQYGAPVASLKLLGVVK